MKGLCQRALVPGVGRQYSVRIHLSPSPIVQVGTIHEILMKRVRLFTFAFIDGLF